MNRAPSKTTGRKLHGACDTTQMRHVGEAASFTNALNVKPVVPGVTTGIRHVGDLAALQVRPPVVRLDGAGVTTKERHVSDAASFPNVLIVNPDGVWITAKIGHVGELAPLLSSR